MNIESTELQNSTETAIGYIPCYRLPFLSLFHADCMEIMKQYPDKYFDLAIVDPPYGIEDKISKGGGSHTKSNAKFHQMYSENNKKWDVRPTDEYWCELRRVSKNQIIWGGNYFGLPECRCFIVWDKVRAVENYSNLEYAWTSFDRHAKMFQYCNNAGFVLKPIDKKIHPTQKPVSLYTWQIQKFATEGMKILDTHFGSGSIALAVDKANRLDKMNLHLTACEIDKEYIDKAIKRISESIKQGTLPF